MVACRQSTGCVVCLWVRAPALPGQCVSMREDKVLPTVNGPVNYIGTIKSNMVVLVTRLSFQCCF